MYTIQILKGGEAKRNRVLDYLRQRIAKDGRFTANMECAMDRRLPSIHIKPVRLTKAKPYCGQHPGECVVNPFTGPTRKPRATWLEWDDWVAFHHLVNRALNRLRTHADVWSTPPDVRGKMWIRRGIKARLRYEWTEEPGRYGLPIREWNQGTFDQFLGNHDSA